jgi:hypothetical protein
MFRPLETTLACAAVLTAAACAPRSEPLPEALQRAVDGIRADAIERDVRFLADDRLAGRATGTPGFLEAAEYVAARFETLGLRPAGGDGTFLQFIEFRQAEIIDEGSSLEIRHGDEVTTLRPYVDYYFGPDKLRETVDVTAPLVFAGFGVTAPELDWDDYAEIDVRGKVVVLFGGAPPSFPHNERAHFSSSRVKRRNARDRGALGMLWMRTPDREASRPFTLRVKNARMPRLGWFDAAGAVVDVHPELRVAASLSPEGMEIVFAGSPKPLEQIFIDVEEGRPGAFDLPTRISARQNSRLTTVRSPNVAGILPGRDPELAGQFVVLTAHLDHLGVGVPTDGDSVFNGAFDNASGSSILMEVARAFSELEPKPARSLLFLAVTGEEKGLLGSDYFAHHPTVPMESIVANVNIDMVTMLHPLHDVVAFGAEHSTLARPLERAARHSGIEIAPDPVPEEVIFVRSDQYSFVRQGVPALYVVPGNDSGDPGVDGLALKEAWRSKIYHSPQDDLSQDIAWEMGVTFARLEFLLTSFVADAPARPLWNQGDFFGELFGGPMVGAGPR